MTQYDEEAHAITPRDMHFRWDDVAWHYIPGEMVATHVYNVMHLLLPEGEKAMSQALAAALPLIHDPRLREEVVGFIGQEATHADNHGGMRDHLAEQGLDVAPVMARLERLVGLLMGDFGSEKVRHQLLCERLALFAALEHYTAVWGKFFLESEGLAASGIDPMMLDLLRWHGAEEVEHRSVVFDAYQHVDGSYARRVRMAVLGSAALAAAGLMTLSYLVAQDPVRKRTRNPYQRFAKPWVEMVTSTRAGLIPNLLGFVTEIPTYVDRSFHPSQLDGMELAVRYLASAPVEGR